MSSNANDLPRIRTGKRSGRLITDPSEWRRWLFDHHRATAEKGMRDSNFPDPVGLILDLSNHHARQMAMALGMGEGELRQHRMKWDRNFAPTAIGVCSFEVAKQLMPHTSPTSLERLNHPRPAGVHWVIVIARGGNSYIGVPLDTGFFPADGQHRISSNGIES